MSRLIMASNQCDVISHSPLRPLSETLFGVAKQKNALWLGWSGEISKDDKRSIRQRELAECELCSWSLTAEEYGDYYHGYVHKQLWPVFHNRPDLAVFQSGAFEAYRRYNERVAEQIADHLCPDDSVWVHDYHLMGVARNLKEAGYLNRCGFFLHHAFPPGEIFRALPEHDWLMQSLFYYDLVGFQSRNDASHFVTWISRRYRTEKVSETLFRVNGHLLRVGVFPCGVAASPPPAGVRKERPRWVVSTDVISDASGIAWRLAALRQLLEQHPQYLHDVTLVQVSDPSRASPCFTPGLRHQLERLCGELNGSYGDFDWSPVNYLHNDTPETARRESLYSQSCIGLFTPFCEGMSLEAKNMCWRKTRRTPGCLSFRTLPARRSSFTTRCSSTPMTQANSAKHCTARFQCRLRSVKGAINSCASKYAITTITGGPAGFLTRWRPTPKRCRILFSCPRTACSPRLAVTDVPCLYRFLNNPATTPGYPFRFPPPRNFSSQFIHRRFYQHFIHSPGCYLKDPVGYFLTA